ARLVPVTSKKIATVKPGRGRANPNARGALALLRVGAPAAVTAGGPFRAELTVVAHQADFGALTILADFFRGLDGEDHGLVLGFVRPVLFVAIFYKPRVSILDDEVPNRRHDSPPQNRVSTYNAPA